MESKAPAGTDRPIGAVVVTYESAAVIADCLESLAAAAPIRGIEIRVVDNASRDGTADIAERILGPGRVIRCPSNRGFAAGVNAGLAALDTPWLAVVNPDVRVPRGSFDRLADELAARNRAGLIAPHVIDGTGQPEPNVGRFPTLARERAHTWFLDRIAGAQGRLGTFPAATAPVDWVSGCLWLMRRDAWRATGALDEGYFMYYEDVDYCRRMHDAGWEVVATPAVEVVHTRGRGSSATGTVPADGGISVVRYFGKFVPGVTEREVRSLLRTGWKLRLGWRRLRMALGDRASAEAARRYELAIRQLDDANGGRKSSAT